MPWKVEKRDDKFCVIKEADGENEGCHDSKQEAMAQMKALYANETKELFKEKGFSLPISFVQLDQIRAAQKVSFAAQEVMWDFQTLADNILYSEEIADKAGAIRQLADELEERIASESLAKESNQEPSWFGRLSSQVANAVKSLLDKSVVKSEFESDMLLLKEAGGTYQVITRYSNKFRDNDHPAEIIASTSHQKFAKLVEAGVVAPPELWLWHVPEWKIGEGLWAAYDDSGFALAGHRVSKENAALIMAMQKAGDVRVSHGMPIWSVRREKDDPTVITEHITTEVSLLPGWAAANKMTSAVILDTKENNDMALSKEQKAALIGTYGVSPELLERLEAQNKDDAQLATSAGVENKEKGAPETPATEPAAPATTPDPTPATKEEAKTEGLAEVTKALEDTMAVVLKLSEKVNDLTSVVKELKVADDQKVAEKAANTPLASLADALRKSVVDSPETLVDGRTQLAKSGPPQAKPDKRPEQNTGIPWIDNLLAGTPAEGGN